MTSRRRGRLTARARLAMLFLLLFLGFGLGLEVLSFVLLREQLPSGAQVFSATAQVASEAPSSAGVTSAGQQLTSDALSADGATVLTAISHYREEAIATYVRISAIALVGLGAVAACVAWWGAHRALRPLRTMATTAHRISANNLSERLPVSGPDDELRDLGETVNQTFDRLEAAFAHERRLVADTSHELRTPVANQRTLLEVTLSDPTTTPERLREVCQTVLEQTMRSESLIRGMLALAGSAQAPLALAPVRLDEAVHDAIAATPMGDLRLSTQLEQSTVLADPALCERAIVNLVGNAVRHNVDGGSIDVTLQSDDTTTSLCITNTSPVLDPERLDELREPFRRAATDRTRSRDGAGLGLAIVDAICGRHGWTLRLETPSAGEFMATIVFPNRTP